MKVCLFGQASGAVFVEALSDALTFNGVDNEIQKGIPINSIKETVPSMEQYSDNLWIGMFHWLLKFPRKFIAYNTESMLLRPDIAQSILNKAIQIWDYSQTNIQWYKQHGISNSAWVPMAYSPIYEKRFAQNVPDINVIKDIDFLFYGIPTPRRQELIGAFRSQGMNVVWLGENGSYNYGNIRDQLIARAKVVISVCKDEPSKLQSNDFSRLSYLIANRAFIVSESVGDLDTENMWSDKISIVPYESILEKCLYYHSRDSDRIEICENAHEFAVNHFNLRRLIPIEFVKKHL